VTQPPLQCQRCRLRPAVVAHTEVLAKGGRLHAQLCSPCLKAVTGLEFEPARAERSPDSDDRMQVAIARQEELLRELTRTDPELRTWMARSPSGGIGFGWRREDEPKVLAALRALPDNAGRAQVSKALQPYLNPRTDAHS
jgi:hypothetical protein